MKIENGKKYKDRNGTVVDITVRSSGALGHPYPYWGITSTGHTRSYDPDGYFYGPKETNNFDLIEEFKVTTPHKFCDVMIAYAQDASSVVQWKRGGRDWRDCDGYPVWDLDNEYRIKPKEVELTVYAQSERLPGNQVTVKSLSETKSSLHNLQLTFDPQGVLVGAQVV